MKLLSAIFLRLMGWRVIIEVPSEIKKGIIVVAPHTSNWDFVFGRLGFASRGWNVKFIIKKESFFFPLGILLRWLGAIPMDRGYSTKTLKRVTDQMNMSDECFLLITPEGTRKLVKHWKKGFYFIAQHAKVPIIYGYLDYKSKVAGLGGVFYPTGNYDEDLKVIEAFYKNKTARYPEKFNLSPQNNKPSHVSRDE